MEEEEVAISDAIASAAMHRRQDGASSTLAASVPLGQRVAAASVGALLTSLATNPLDVVKTRLQAQEAPAARAAASASASTSTPSMAIPAGCREYYATMMETVHGAKVPAYTHNSPGGGGGAGSASSAGGASMAGEAVIYQGTRDALVKIGRTEGLPGLYRGLAPSLAMAVPSTVLYYSLYDSLRDAFQSMGAGPVVAPLVGGSCSRVVAATATAPLELIRTRMQAEAGGGGRLTKTTVDGMVGIIRSSGFLSLWHGLGAQLWRDVPFSAMYWLGYEQLAQALGQRDDDSQAAYMLKSFSAGAGAGMAAAFLTTPFDVIKTRRQVALPGSSSGALPRQPMPSMRTALRCVVATEGYQALFSGALPRTLRIGLACAIMISSYEGGKYLFLRAEKQKITKRAPEGSGGVGEKEEKKGSAAMSSLATAAAATARTTLPSR